MEANYSILVRDAEKTIIPALRGYKMRLLPYMPLASGLLSGKYRGGAIPTGSRLDRMPFMKGFLPKKIWRLSTAFRLMPTGAGSSWRSWLSPGLPEIRLSVA
jgi:aryl-alcohol dehydrogenase-like predicted oxidoreductase